MNEKNENLDNIDNTEDQSKIIEKEKKEIGNNHNDKVKEDINILKIDDVQKELSENNNTNIENENSEKDKKEESKNANMEIEIEAKIPELIHHHRSPFSLEGAKYPLSIYTRRVMNISKIKQFLREDSTAGLCGGGNLGNTCFMNSSIACLSNCTELTYYFLSGDYKNDINSENTHGMQGELAKSWGRLLQEYWVESTKVGNPRDLKNTIGQKVPIFRGYNQHDSNEFMSIFLDYLNEDLNSASTKEYIELDEKQENESDEECSKRFWDSNLRRNDSIVTDLFCGQFKSTIICPNCNFIYITFEPFYSINLPLKEQKRKKRYSLVKKDLDEFFFYYITKYGLRNPYKILFRDIPNTTKIGECFEVIKNLETFKYNGKLKNVIYTKILNKRFGGEINEDDLIDEYDNTFLYELNGEENGEMELKIPIYFIYKKEGDIELSSYPRFVFGKEDMTIDELKKSIYCIIRKHLLSPFLKYGEERDELSDLIMKFKDDMTMEEEYIINLINKEYRRIFNEFPSEEDIEYLQNYLQDMPFKFTLRETEGQKVIEIFDENNLNMLSNDFKEIAEVTSVQSCIKEFFDKIQDFNLAIEFNNDSKYINKKNFKLDTCIIKRLDFPKKEEDKEEVEDEKENHKSNLFEYLKFFSQEEQLKSGNEWYCKNCKQHVLPKKKMDIYYLPKILIICFKRFIKDSSQWEKNDEDIDFPINNFDMKDLIIGPDKDHSIYDLFAVSQHYGSTGFGHYTAVCNNGGKWYNYDDSSIEETSPRSALSSAAYVIFYRRQTD